MGSTSGCSDSGEGRHECAHDYEYVLEYDFRNVGGISDQEIGEHEVREQLQIRSDYANSCGTILPVYLETS